MWNVRTFRFLVAAVGIALFGSQVTAFGQTGGLTGKATIQDGTPCVKCPVIIERLDIKGNYPTKTDKKGNYVYVGLPIGQYKITLKDPNGRTLFYITHHVGLGDPTEVNFDLAKEMAAAKQEQMANPEVKKQVEEQAKDQKQFTGLKQLYDQGNALRAQAAGMLQQAQGQPQQIQEAQQKYLAAAAMFEQAIPVAKDKNLVAILSLTADSYDKAHQFDKAIKNYQEAILLSPSDASLHNGVGNVYAEMGKIPEAQAEFQKSAEADPANASRAYFNLGAIMYNAGKMDEAAAAFKKAVDIDPKYADAYALMGRALMGKLTMGADGKVQAPPGTVEALEAYLKLDPNGKYAQEAQADLQVISGKVETEFKSQKKKKG